MSTFKNKLFYPILAAVIAGLILFWLKDEIPKRPDITANLGTITTESQNSDTWPSAVKELVDDMETIQGGLFQMGCTAEQKDCDYHEKPAHWVRLSDYQIGKYEVTQAQWKAVMNSNNAHFEDCDRCPMENVSWNEVQLFMEALNQITGKKFRLPTEAEWEFAARGGKNNKKTVYAGSNDIDEVAWYDGNSGGKTHIVGQKKANELGLYDMSGNIWEWCSDWYGNYSSTTKPKPQENPRGAKSGDLRVLRGAGWDGNPHYCRVSDRSFGDPSSRNINFGFRLAHSL